MWYIVVEGKTEGPFSFLELRKDSRITPDTFVWREGFEGWKRIREVPELKSLFDEDKKDASEKDVDVDEKENIDEEIVLDSGLQPPFFIWSLIATLIVLYFLLQLIWKS